jgi:nicotinamide riboside transporter PnuC
MGKHTLKRQGSAMLFGREPVQYIQLLSGVAILLAPILHWNADQTGALIAAVTALGGLLTAWAVSAEKAAPFVAGLIKAMLAVGLAFRLRLEPETVSGLMVFAEAAVAFWLRTQVVARVPAAVPERGES